LTLCNRGNEEFIGTTYTELVKHFTGANMHMQVGKTFTLEIVEAYRTMEEEKWQFLL